MRQHLVLLLLCGSPLYPAAVNPVANVTSIDIQDVVDAVDNHNWEQFFKIYGKAKTDDDRVKCLRRLFFSEPGHNVGRLGLVHALDTANRSVLEKLEISAQWKVYLLSIQPSLKYAFEHVDAGVLKRAKEIEAKKAAEAQKKENDKNKILKVMQDNTPQAHQNVHPFKIIGAIQPSMPTEQSHGFYFRDEFPSRFLADISLRRGCNRYARLIVLAGLGYFDRGNRQESAHFNRKAVLEPLTENAEELHLIEKLCNLPGIMRMANVTEYDEAIQRTVAVAGQALEKFPKDLLPVIAGYAVPYRFGRPLSTKGTYNWAMGSYGHDSDTGEDFSVMCVFYTKRLVDEIDRIEKPESLGQLSLAFNLIQRVPAAMCTGMRSLTELHLSDNRIETIDDTAFDGAPKLKKLSLNKNCLREFPRMVERLPRLRELHILDNPFMDDPRERLRSEEFQLLLSARRAYLMDKREKKDDSKK